MKLNRNIKNIISLFSLEFIARAAAFIAVTYLARILNTEGFGVINIGLAVLSYAMIVANGGLTVLGTKKIAAGSGETGKVTGDIFLSRLFFALILFLVSSAVTYLFISPPEFADVIFVYLFFLFPSAVLLEWFFQGIQEMEIITFGRAAGMAAYLLFLFLFVRLPGDTILTAVGWVIGGIFNSAFLFYLFYRKKYALDLSFKHFNFIKVYGESIPMGLGAVFAQFVIQFPVLYLGFASGASEAGIFSAAYKFIVLLLVFDRVFNALFFPKIVHYRKVNTDLIKLSEVFNRILKIISFSGLSIAVAAVLFGKYLVTIIFGMSFAESEIVFQVLVGTFYFTLVNSVFTYTLFALNKEKVYTMSLFIAMVIFLILILVLTKYFGSAGSAAAMVCFEFTCLLIMYVKLKQVINIVFFKSVILPLIIGLILTLVLLIVHAAIVIQLAAVLIAVSAAIIWIARNEFNFIKSIIRS